MVRQNTPVFLTQRTVALVLILAAIAIVLTWATWYETISDRREIERLMATYVQSIGDVISESGAHGMQAYFSWQDELARRLLDNARWIARWDALSPLSSDRLDEVALTHSLNRIHVFDARGESAVSNRPPDHDDAACHEAERSAGQGLRCRDLVRPICEGFEDSIEIGFREGRLEAGVRFAAAAARPDGGAVLVNVRADSLRTTLEEVEPAHLIETLGRSSGVEYVVIQDRERVLAASAGGFDPGPLPTGLLEGVPSTFGSIPVREFESDGGRVLEVVRMLQIPEVGKAYLRVGLDADVFTRARENLRARAWGRSLVFVVAAGLAFALAMAWQRHRILDREIHTIRDELRVREREAARAARLAAMGELAASVAHQIRNPLNTIHMTAQQMGRDLGRRESLAEQAARVRDESRRIDGIVQQFLDLARPPMPNWRRLDVATVVGECASGARASFEAQEVRLETVLESATAELDRELVTEIVENLLHNARQASAAGGRVRIEVRRAGRDVEITVRDQGPGVTEDLSERIFDPYFTTKSSGTGLGLSLVARMAAAMGGGVRLENPGEPGSCFKVWLPRKRSSGKTPPEAVGAEG